MPTPATYWILVHRAGRPTQCLWQHGFSEGLRTTMAELMMQKDVLSVRLCKQVSNLGTEPWEWWEDEEGEVDDHID